MSDQLFERQSHVIYALTITLVVVATALCMDYQLGASARYALLKARGGPDIGSSWTVLLVACGAYVVFRLVRPFAFSTADGQVPEGALHWFGNLFLTLAGSAAVTFLAWAVLHPAMTVHYRTAALALSVSMLVGFMLVEASLVRKRSTRMLRAVQLDAGLLSALLIVPACLLWFVSTAPRSGLGMFLSSLFASDSWRLGFPFLLAGVIFVLWLVSKPLRRNLQSSAAYRAATGAIWVFGVSAYGLLGVVTRRRSDGGGLLTDLWAFTYAQPGVSLIMMGLLWLAVAGGLYFFSRKPIAP